MTASNLSQINTNTTNSSQELLISSEAYIAVAVILFLIGLLGFLFNLTVIIFTCTHQKQLWTPLNVVVFNLVLSDFLVSILGIPWSFAAAINFGYFFNDLGCVLYGFVMGLSGISSITSLSVLAFERYLIVAHSFRIDFFNAYVSIVVIWLYSLFLTTPPIFGWGQYNIEGAHISCSINWEERSKNSMSYILFLFTFGFVLPLSLIIFSYVNIIIKIRKPVLQKSQVRKTEHKITLMVFLMVIAFLLAWTPYALLALIMQFGDPSLVTPSVAVIPALLAKSSICYNPIIYIGLNAQFQQTLKQKWRRRRSEAEPVTTAENLTTVGVSKKNICREVESAITTAC